jgi:hypothetical protein
VSRPPDSESSVVACLATSAGLLRQGTLTTSVVRPMRSVTAAAAASAISGS